MPCLKTMKKRQLGVDTQVSNYLSNPKPEYITGGSRRRLARRDGWAGKIRARRDADGSVREVQNSHSYPA